MRVTPSFIQKFLILFCVIFFTLLPVHEAFAASGSFSFYPIGGYVRKGEEFTVDIKINSGGENISLARVVFVYDPDMVEIIKADKNASLFCNWPTDQQTVDNTNGVYRLTGYCQSGEGTLYTTQGEPDVFTRIKFRALKEGKIDFEWEYSGEDLPYKSVIMKDGSPTQNILSTAPTNVTFTSVVGTPNTNPTTPTTPTNQGNTPQTNIIDKESIVIGGVIAFGSILVLVGGTLMSTWGQKALHKKYKTFVVVDNQD